MYDNVLIIHNARGQYSEGTKLNKKTMKFIFGEDNLVIYDDFKNIKTGMYKLGNICFNYLNTYKHSIFFGGDHLTSFGTILGCLKKYNNNFKIVWMDAHTDIHNFDTSPSKNLHGMVVNFLLNHTYPDIPRLLPNQILYVGIRSVEKEEWNFIKKWNIDYIKMEDINIDLNRTINKIKKFVKSNNVHVSLDVDVFDPSIMFSTGTREPDGMYLDQFEVILETIKCNSNHFSTDIMEFNSKIGKKDKVQISIETIKNCIKTIGDNECR